MIWSIKHECTTKLAKSWLKEQQLLLHIDGPLDHAKNLMDLIY